MGRKFYGVLWTAKKSDRNKEFGIQSGNRPRPFDTELTGGREKTELGIVSAANGREIELGVR